MSRHLAMEWNRVGVFAAANSASEIGLGSFLHACHVPLAGHVLANLQGLILAAFCRENPANFRKAFYVSAVSGSLKSLSPAGKRLRPMLAIYVQGLLFHLAVNFFGAGFFGLVLGQTLIGAWCGLQTFALQYLIFGPDLLASYESLFSVARGFFPIVPESPLILLSWWVGLSALVGGVIGICGKALPDFSSSFCGDRIGRGALTSRPEDLSWPKSALAALRELKRPYFVWPFLFVFLFSWIGKNQWDLAAVILGRALLVGFIVALFVQRINFHGIVSWLRRRGMPGPAEAFETAIQELNRRQNFHSQAHGLSAAQTNCGGSAFKTALL